MEPKIFGWEHLTFLAVFVVIMVVALILVKKFAKTVRTQNIIVKCVALILFITVVWNRISLAVLQNNPARLIPNTFCGMSNLVLSLAVLFGGRNNNVLHFVFYFAIVGGFVTLIYPTFLEDYLTFFHTVTTSGLLHHALSFFLCVLLELVGYFSPNYKKWPNLVIGFMAYMTVGAFLIFVLDVNTAFYMNRPCISGTPLTVWVLIPIFAGGYAFYMTCHELIRRHLKNRKKNKEVDFKTIMKIVNKEI